MTHRLLDEFKAKLFKLYCFVDFDDFDNFDDFDDVNSLAGKIQAV